MTFGMLVASAALSAAPAGGAADSPSGGTAGVPTSGATSPTGTSGPAVPTGPTGPTGEPPVPKTEIHYRPVGCIATGPTRARSDGPARRVVAIGFDDGPARDTDAFVRMLERAHTQATFFVIGEQVVPAYRAVLLRELRDGDTLGDHSFTHPFLTRTGDVRGQLSRTLGRIRGLTGYTPCVFRPPYGDYNHGVVATARALGLATVLWDVDPSDYRLPGTTAIEQRILSAVRPGSIILSHDGGGPRGETLAAYPHIIAGIRAKGYRIETIPQLLGYRPVYNACAQHCDGLGLTRAQLPAGAVVRG